MLYCGGVRGCLREGGKRERERLYFKVFSLSTYCGHTKIKSPLFRYDQELLPSLITTAAKKSGDLNEKVESKALMLNF